MVNNSSLYDLEIWPDSKDAMKTQLTKTFCSWKREREWKGVCKTRRSTGVSSCGGCL